MSIIKIPIFGSVVSNADPSDLQKPLSPASANFSISTPGILRLRDGATLNFTDGSRGINSIFLWTHPDLDNGAEFIGYCNQRGILFRLNADLTSFSNLDSYDGLIPMGSDNSTATVFGYETDWVKTLYNTIPKSVSFTALGSSVLINMGLNQDSLLISRIKDKKIFGRQFTIPSGTYLNPAISSYPTTFSLTASDDDTAGSMPDGAYRYNASPIFDGVNELPLDEDKSVALTMSGGVSQQAKITLSLSKDDMPRNMTGVKIYRAPVAVGVPLSYRNIKQVNFRAPKGANSQDIVSVTDADATVSTGLTSRYAIFCPSASHWAKSTLIYQINAQMNSAGTERTGYFSKASNGTYTDVTEANVRIILYAESPDQTGTSKDVGNGEMRNFLYGALAMSGTMNEDTGVEDLSLADWDSLQPSGWSNRLMYSLTTHDEAQLHSSSSQNGWNNLDGAYMWIECIYDRDQSVANVGIKTDGVKSFFQSNCYMGTDKIFFKEDLFTESNTHLGKSVKIDTNDNGSTNYTFEMASHGENWLSVKRSDADGSTAWLDDTGQLSPVNGSATIVNGKTTRVTITDTVGYTLTGSAVSMEYLDTGDIDKGMPPLSSKTLYKSRWKYSEYHGGRLFVANVLIAPREEHELHDDMILFSESGMPTLIPISNYIRIRDPQGGGIQGLKTMGDSLAVFMEHGIYRLRVPTSDPKSFQVVESNENVGCVAPESIIKIEDSTYFCGVGNIYKVDGMFNVKDIGDAILDSYLNNTNLENSIVEYDSLNELVLFRFGNDKRTIWEYNIRTGDWNRSAYQGKVSTMISGATGQTFFTDNTHITITRADGSSNEDEPIGGGEDDDPCDPSFDFDQGHQDSSWDDLIKVYDSMEEQSNKLGTTHYFNVATTSGSNVVVWKSGANIATSIAVGNSVSGWGVGSGTTVTGIDVGDAGNNISASFAMSTNATESAVSPTPGFSSMWFYGHNNATTFYGNKRLGTPFFNYSEYYALLKDTDFSSYNTKFENGWLYNPQVNSADVDYSYVALEIIDDNCNLYDVTGSNRPFVQCKLKMLDSSYWTTGQITGTTKFMPVYNYIEPTDDNGDENYPISGSEVYAFFLQAELHKLVSQTEDESLYDPYILGDYATWELNAGSPSVPSIVTNTPKSRTIIIKANSIVTQGKKADFEYGYNSWYIYYTDILWWKKYADFNVEHAETGTGTGTGGCMDILANNYNASATYDDGTCAYDDVVPDPPPTEETVIASDPDTDSNLYWSGNLAHDTPGERANLYTWLSAQTTEGGYLHVTDMGETTQDIMKNPGNHAPATLTFQKYKLYGYVSSQSKWKPLKMTGSSLYGVPYVYIYWLKGVNCSNGDDPCVSYGSANPLPTLTQSPTPGYDPFGNQEYLYKMFLSSVPNETSTGFSQANTPYSYTPHYDQLPIV